MKKHDAFTALFSSIAIAGAILWYLGYGMTGQLIFAAACMPLAFMTKLIGAPLQIWAALLSMAAMGFVMESPWLSVATVLSCLAINLRGLVFQDAIYTRALWVDPLLGVLGLGVYLIVNLLYPAGWMAWTFPGFFVALGVILGLLNYADRARVRQMLEMGVIEIGLPAPDFTLNDQNGTPVTLSAFRGVRHVLLLFVRGDWCPGCHIMLRLYEKHRARFQEKNVMLLAIGPDPSGVNRAMVEKLGVDFAVLSDEKSQAARQYCVSVQQDGVSKMNKHDEGIPLPASFLISSDGIVRYTSRADNAGEFLRPDIIFEVLARL